MPPTTATLSQLKAGLYSAAAEGSHGAVIEAATGALRIASLDPGCYAHRAASEAFLSQTEVAETDFRAALYLQPHWNPLVLDEGAVWMAVGESKRCANRWRKELARSRDGETLFALMLTLARGDAVVQAFLRKEAALRPRFLLAYLETARPIEAATEISMLLLHDPGLTTFADAEREKLFAVWFRASPDSFLRAVAGRPDWQKLAWRPMAEALAQQKDFHAAWVTVERFGPPPALPPPPQGHQSMQELEREFYMHPRDIAKGTLLALAQLQQGLDSDALVTVQKLRKLPGAPGYLTQIEATLHARQAQWEDAWRSWQAGQ